MPEKPTLTKPWLVAVWPGMGHVAISAGYYLMSKLDMHLLAEFSPRGLFELEHVEVQHGLIRPARLPRSRFFVWHDPEGVRDIVVFIGEAQPPLGKYHFCQGLIDFARQLGVERVFTFAAMATQMHPQEPSRVFAAATDREQLSELQQYDLFSVDDGQIAGLNGLLLAAAAEGGIRGASLLGEMPQIFSQLPFPKASMRVLEVFTKLANLNVDFTELDEQSTAVEEQLVELLTRVEESIAAQTGVEQEFGEEEYGAPAEEEPRISPEDAGRLETLFNQARGDRRRAYELKKELDRLGVFKDYEDQFLDLFKKQAG